MSDRVDAILEALQGAETPEACTEIVQRESSHLGAGAFAYINLGPTVAPYYFQTTYPQEWTSRYEANRYIHFDPIAENGRQSLIPFHWRDVQATSRNRAAKAILWEGEQFGLRNGISVPLHGVGGGFSMLSLSSPDPAFDAEIRAKQSEIHLLGLYYHAAVERLLSKNNPPVRLSAKEREVLLWALNGKSAWDTSVIMGISERTVVFHIENAKTKLGVRTKIEAVTKAIIVGAIIP